MNFSIRVLVFLLMICIAMISCSSNENDDDDDNADSSLTDDTSGDDAADDTASVDVDADKEKLRKLFDEMEFEKFIGIAPVRTTQGPNGYTYYHFSTDDCRCTFGDEMKVAVHIGTENKVMLFMEGGGATWPGGGFAVPLDYPLDIGFKSFDEANPLRDWSYVYLPHCDHSIHIGNNELFYDGGMRYHHGLKQIGAAVSLMLDLFPDPEKILVAGSSAGGYGTYMGWGLVKSQYMNTDTYIMNDSGTGFWNPDDLVTWELLKDTWKINIPEECTRCDGPIVTYIYELFMQYDHQLRIGLFSSYNDWIISTWFLGMTKERFHETLMTVTDEIYANYPYRFHRFFVDGDSHTTYEFLLPGGPKYDIRGTTLYQWIGQLVDEDPAWEDLLE